MWSPHRWWSSMIFHTNLWDQWSDLSLGYRLEDSRIAVGILAGERNFSLLQSVQTCCGALQISYSFGTLQCLCGVKRPGREADQSDASNDKVKNAWSYTASTPYVFMAFTGVLLIWAFIYFIKLVFKRKWILIVGLMWKSTCWHWNSSLVLICSEVGRSVVGYLNLSAPVVSCAQSCV
jgi:hypothetical protein